MPTPRQIAHAETLDRILRLGRDQLAVVGPQNLSLRAIARELGVSSSAVYRYVASRDELLTRLITAAYDALGEHVEKADRSARRSDHLTRWRKSCHAVRTWAAAHPHEWALVYGSPVPDYAAPQETLEPAARAARVLVGIAVDAGGRAGGPEPTGALRTQLETVAADFGADLDLVTMGALVDAWTHLFGVVSLERFGHLVGTVDPTDAYFSRLVDDLAVRVGIA
ncbi:TetR/AcrR family transcriptional regulator [Mariniluteicoccus endophyticus]